MSRIRSAMRVAEEADQAIELGPAAVCDRTADDDLVLAGDPVEQDGECGQERHVRSRADRTTEGDDSTGRLGREIDLVVPAFVALR